LELALAVLDEALRIAPELQEIQLSAGVALALAGKIDHAIRVLEGLGTQTPAGAIAQENIQRINKGLNPLDYLSGLRTLGSGLNLPTQRELASGRLQAARA
jgi:hypothetical protein